MEIREVNLNFPNYVENLSFKLFSFKEEKKGRRKNSFVWRACLSISTTRQRSLMGRANSYDAYFQAQVLKAPLHLPGSVNGRPEATSYDT